LNVSSPDPEPAASQAAPPGPESLRIRLRHFLFGRPHDLADQSVYHQISLIPFLAWVGLGADGLSSSSYGPDEAFRTLGEHTYLAVGLAAMMAITVFVISAAYSRIIEEFPHGGGGYVVATKLLGERVGVVSGCALLVDYILTITVSIAAAGDAIFSFLPLAWHAWKFAAELGFIALLMVLNIRGVRESVLVLMPVFLVFLLTHLVIIAGGLVAHAGDLPATFHEVSSGFRHGSQTLGAWGMFLLFIHAYSLGGGTYTGIEAVSNGLPIMREPRVQTARRTMVYMSSSLAFTASGLLLCYLLWGVGPVEGKTMNAVLIERMTDGFPLGGTFLVLSLISEGTLLVVAAQAGFIDGPRVLANMAVDSWMPHGFAALSERLTTMNGVVLMGAASIAALVYTGGDVRALVIMYSINVFLTFSLSMFGMVRSIFQTRAQREHWKRRFTLFVAGCLLCVTILCITTFEKFSEGGWVTLLVTGCLVVVCFLVRRHYRTVYAKLNELYDELGKIPLTRTAPPGEIDPRQPTAVLLVAGYGALGIHTLLNIFRAFPNHFKSVVFASVGVIDSGGFKGEGAIDGLKERSINALDKYVMLARGLGIPATYRYAIGTDAVDEAEKLCLQIAKEFPQSTFFAGQVIFHRESWYQRLLHNETAFAIQKRLQWGGKTMVILPARVT
jgi:amino acid transporter